MDKLNLVLHSEQYELKNSHENMCTNTRAHTRKPSCTHQKNSHKSWLDNDILYHLYLTIQWVNHNFIKFIKIILHRLNDKFATDEKNYSSAGCDSLTAAFYDHTSYQHYVWFIIYFFLSLPQKTVSIILWTEGNKSQRFLYASIVTYYRLIQFMKGWW